MQSRNGINCELPFHFSFEGFILRSVILILGVLRAKDCVLENGEEKEYNSKEDNNVASILHLLGLFKMSSSSIVLAIGWAIELLGRQNVELGLLCCFFMTTYSSSVSKIISACGLFMILDNFF